MCRARTLWRTRGEAQGRGGAGTSGRRGSRQIEGRKGQNLNSELQTVLTLIYKPEPKRLRSQERSRLAIPAGLEPATRGVEIRYSIQLSYGTVRPASV